MDQKKTEILEAVRQLAIKEGIEAVTIKHICEYVNISRDDFDKYFENAADLVSKVLTQERESFEGIFEEYDFEGVNAIEILLTVSKVISERFHEVNPYVTIDLKKRWPQEYQEHFTNRIDFIFDKIKINLHKGISQGIYRPDLSIELVARLYISRLIDLHNPDLFPRDKFSFHTLFEEMFDSLILTIATDKGLAHYEKHKPEYSF